MMTYLTKAVGEKKTLRNCGPFFLDFTCDVEEHEHSKVKCD